MIEDKWGSSIPCKDPRDLGTCQFIVGDGTGRKETWVCANESSGAVFELTVHSFVLQVGQGSVVSHIALEVSYLLQSSGGSPKLVRCKIIAVYIHR